MRVFSKEKAIYGRLMSYILKPVYTILNFFQKKKDVKKIQRILIIENARIGDLIMAIPAFRVIKNHFSDAKIDLLCGGFGHNLLKNNTIFNKIIPFNCPWVKKDYSPKNLINMLKLILRLRRENYDLGIELRGDIRNLWFLYHTKAKRKIGYALMGGEYFLNSVIPNKSNLNIKEIKGHLVEGNLQIAKYLGCEIKDIKPKLWTPKQKRQKIIGIHPGAAAKVREWKTSNWVKLIKRILDETKNNIWILEDPGSPELVNDILQQIPDAYTDRISIKATDLYNLSKNISKCRILVCIDSGAAHIASAVDTPIVVLFGPQFPEKTHPISKDSELVYVNISCRGCLEKCIQPTNICMESITVEDVFKKIKILLEKTEI